MKTPARSSVAAVIAFLCAGVGTADGRQPVPLVSVASWQRTGMGEVTFECLDADGSVALLRINLCGERGLRLQAARSAAELEAPPDELRRRPTSVREAGQQVEVKTEKLTIAVRKRPVSLTVRLPDGRVPLSTLGRRGLALPACRTEGLANEGIASGTTVRLRVQDGEMLYGRGLHGRESRPGGRGPSLSLSIRTSTQPMRVGNPFSPSLMLSNLGYGLCLNTARDADARLERSGRRVTLKLEAPKIDLYVFCGPKPSAVLEQYIAVSGRPALPPPSALGESEAFNEPARADERYAVTWLRPSSCSFAELAECVRAGLSLGLSGIPFWGCDSPAAPATGSSELQLRWAQFGAFCPVIWRAEHDGEAARTQEFFANLRANLTPYVEAAADRAHRRGEPLVRALVCDFPDDSTCAERDDEFLFGPDLLAAPMVSEGFARTVYLPPGAWLDFWESRTYAGGRDVLAHAPPSRLPLFVRAGSVIPMRLNEALQVGEPPGHDPLLVFDMDARNAGRALVLHGREPIKAAYERKGTRVEIRVDECDEPYALRVRCGDPRRMALPLGEALNRMATRETFAQAEAAWCYDFAEQRVLVKFPDGHARKIVMDGAGWPIEFAGWAAPDEARGDAKELRLTVTARRLPENARARLEYGIAGRPLSSRADGKASRRGEFVFRAPIPPEAASSGEATGVRYRAVLMTDRGEMASAERTVRVLPARGSRRGGR